ncbi:M15 family metallopeptidase [Metabacillus sp. 84]|uniref:M15 family metallopeptidase n=1 Tax=Metabacillus sp. 84 TaxID=3404705 RepID=UPI003CF9325D
MKKMFACSVVPFMLFTAACSVEMEENLPSNDGQKQTEEKEIGSVQENQLVLENEYFNALETVEGEDVITNPENILVLVNKEYTLPADYKPKDLTVPNVPFSFGEADVPQKYIRKEAAAALEKLFDGAKKNSIELFAVSGFRSYDRQENILDQEITSKGEAKAEQAVAHPGQSEHQTGLAMDISSRSADLEISKKFGETKEGKWVKENAYKYGYIIRYPEDKAEVTEYQYEPWHLRYVGEKTAKVLHEKNLTLEEYFEQVKKI